MAVAEYLPGDLQQGIFVKRENRFVARVEVGGRVENVHVPSSGRMRELLVPGAPVYVAPARGKARKTRYTLLLAAYGDILVSVDSLLPNRLFGTAAAAGALQEFSSYTGARPEYRHGNSRFDFCLTGDAGCCLVEVKSVTLVQGGGAMFPDAPSLRGAKHLEELAGAVEKGIAAAVVFIVQRGDARFFTPHAECDPAFAAALRKASGAGVNIYAYGCRVSPEKVELDDRIPVNL